MPASISTVTASSTVSPAAPDAYVPGIAPVRSTFGARYSTSKPAWMSAQGHSRRVCAYNTPKITLNSRACTNFNAVCINTSWPTDISGTPTCSNANNAADAKMARFDAISRATDGLATPCSTSLETSTDLPAVCSQAARLGAAPPSPIALSNASMPSTRMNASSYTPVRRQIPNKSSRFSIRSAADDNTADTKPAPLPLLAKYQVKRVIAPPTRPVKSKAIIAKRTAFRRCTVCVQRLSVSGAANLTATSATSANTASCSNAASSVSEGMAFIAANDATSSTANAATSFPFRTLRTSSAHTPLTPPRRFSRFARKFPSQICKYAPNDRAPSVPDGKKAGAFRHRPETCSYSRAQPAAITGPGPSSARRRDGG